MKKRYALIALLTMIILTACGAETEEFEETTLSVDKKGEITEFIISDFDKDYYNESELNDLIDKTIAEYNQKAGEDKVSLKEFVKGEDNKIRVTTLYKSSEDYTGMNGRTLFTGTVSEAKAAGYGIADAEGVTDESSIIVSEEAIQITVPKNIIAVSTGSEKRDDKKAKLPGNFGYIIY